MSNDGEWSPESQRPGKTDATDQDGPANVGSYEEGGDHGQGKEDVCGSPEVDD
jgi:hypothetical protein